MQSKNACLTALNIGDFCSVREECFNKIQNEKIENSTPGIGYITTKAITCSSTALSWT